MLCLTLYDIPSKLPGKHWSPNPAKPRFVLSYKGLPYETVWAEYPDIAAKMKEIGASPNKREDGSDIYAVPVLSDPNTGALGVISVFDGAYCGVIRPAVNFILARGAEVFNKPSADYILSVTQEGYGEKTEEGCADPSASALANLQEGYATTNEWYEKTGSKGKWLLGDIFSYADIIVACRLLWYKRILHEDEWSQIASWEEGRWAKLLADVEKEVNIVYS
ncbi:hypothetical protein HYDPIDRAFT_26838 [Hydnomerulius pinastri MD-312]|nr:hypothetical protein HYDPIDRAFT_26838 [Hydnomerulius pinastri MD-312]